MTRCFLLVTYKKQYCINIIIIKIKKKKYFSLYTVPLRKTEPLYELLTEMNYQLTSISIWITNQKNEMEYELQQK